MMPFADMRGVALPFIAGNEAVAVKQSVALAAHRKGVRRVATFRLMPHEGMMGVTDLLPRAGGQRLRGPFQWAGPFVVADGVMPPFGGDGVEVNAGTAAAVRIEVRWLSLPERAVALEHRQELIAHVFGAAHMTVGQQRPHPERLPG